MQLHETFQACLPASLPDAYVAAQPGRWKERVRNSWHLHNTVAAILQPQRCKGHCCVQLPASASGLALAWGCRTMKSLHTTQELEQGVRARHEHVGMRDGRGLLEVVLEPLPARLGRQAVDVHAPPNRHRAVRAAAAAAPPAPLPAPGGAQMPCPENPDNHLRWLSPEKPSTAPSFRYLPVPSPAAPCFIAKKSGQPRGNTDNPGLLATGR